MITSEWPTPEHPDWAPFVVRQVESLRHTGVKVDLFHFRGAGNVLNYLRAWRQVRARLSQSHYDLVHAQFGQSGLVALPKRLPLVVTFRGSDLKGIVGPNGRYTLTGCALRLVGQIVAHRADEIIVVSESLAKFLPCRSYTIIPSGLDLDLFRPLPKVEARQALRLPPDHRLVLFVGNPDRPEKRFALAREVMSYPGTEMPASLIIAHGVPYAQMPLYMNACDALLVTSSHEGSPNAVKEALACNLPVVSVAVGDVRERIGSVEGCVVCADDRPETIAAGLAEVLQRRERIEGREAVQDLDERILTQRLLRVYDMALSKQGKERK